MNYGDDISQSAHRLHVIGWNEGFRAHECHVEGTKTRAFVDFFVCGAMPENEDEQSIIGKTIEVEYTHGFLWLAEGPRIVEG